MSDIQTVKIGKLTFEIDDENAILVKCEKYAEEIEIPAKVNGVIVSEIGSCAFEGCTALKSVALPEYTIEQFYEDEDGLGTIGSNAFYQCTSLTEIHISYSVRIVGRGAFACCTSLKKVCFDEFFAPFFHPYAFSKCDSLVEFPAISNLNEGLFDGCKSLTTLPIQSYAGTIPERCFAHCTGLTEIVIPEGVDTIEGLAFRSCHELTKVTFENTRGWRCSSIYFDAYDVDVTDPEQNAKILKYQDFDDGVVKWCRKTN